MPSFCWFGVLIMTYRSNHIAAHLLRIGAVKINAKNPFTWSSGLKSPIYCDNRLLLSYPEVRTAVQAAFVEAALNWHHFDVVGGVATAGIPHGVLVADALKKPFIYVRSKPKAHGRQNQIEGHLHEGAAVLLIEDLISTGGSSIRAAEAIIASGGNVSGVLAIFSYGFELAQRGFDNAGIPFRTLITLDDLLEAAQSTGSISPDEKQLIMSWRMKPEQWAQNVQ